MLPRARKTNQLPAEIYADNLKRFGVRHGSARDHGRAHSRLSADARARWSRWRGASPQSRSGCKTADYRDVIRELKKQRIAGRPAAALYTRGWSRSKRSSAREARGAAEARSGHPARDAGGVRRAARAAHRSAAPDRQHRRAGGVRAADEQSERQRRRGHGRLQLRRDRLDADGARSAPRSRAAVRGDAGAGVSTARVVFAFNSANVEGWALYAEAVIKQYLPPEGQIGALQMRMMREARAFLDPMLNLGLIEPDAAKRFLMEEVMLSEPMAKQEVDRYTFQRRGRRPPISTATAGSKRCARRRAGAGGKLPKAPITTSSSTKACCRWTCSIARSSKSSSRLTRRCRNPRHGGSSRPTACRARDRKRWR